MFEIVEKRELAENIYLTRVKAPRIANSAKPGQFVIVRADKVGERTPLTIADYDAAEGTVTLVTQALGVSTRKIVAKGAGEYLADVAGPLGRPSDFMEEPIPKYFRLFPGNEVRLKGAYVIKCTGCVKDADGNVIEVLAEYDVDSKGGNTADGRKVKSTIHWVDAATAVDAEVRLYSNLFADADPDAGDKDFLDCLAPDSLETLTDCKLEAALADAVAPAAYQFMRLGYFSVDNKDSKPGHLVFNRSVSLKDSFKAK